MCVARTVYPNFRKGESDPPNCLVLGKECRIVGSPRQILMHKKPIARTRNAFGYPNLLPGGSA